MSVLKNWRTEAPSRAKGRVNISAMKAFKDAPSVVPPQRDYVDLFPGSLSDIAHVKRAGPAIKGEPPGISNSVCEYLVAAGRWPEERVRARRSVGCGWPSVIYVYA